MNKLLKHAFNLFVLILISQSSAVYAYYYDYTDECFINGYAPEYCPFYYPPPYDYSYLSVGLIDPWYGYYGWVNYYNYPGYWGWGNNWNGYGYWNNTYWHNWNGYWNNAYWHNNWNNWNRAQNWNQFNNFHSMNNLNHNIQTFNRVNAANINHHVYSPAIHHYNVRRMSASPQHFQHVQPHMNSYHQFQHPMYIQHEFNNPEFHGGGMEGFHSGGFHDEGFHGREFGGFHGGGGGFHRR